MKDRREKLLEEMQNVVISNVDPKQADDIINALTIVLGNYEVYDRCTDIAVRSDINEKLIQRYASCLLIDGKSLKTIAQYKRTIQRLADFIGKPYQEMTSYDIRLFLASDKQRGVSNCSLENTRTYISTFFQWMTKEEIIPRNIVLSVSKIKVPKEIKKAFSDVEIDALRGACTSIKEQALIEFLLSTGVRVDELSQMDRCDVDMASMKVHVRHGKGNKERITYINNIGRKHLVTYLHSRNDESLPLFLNYRHERLNTGGVRSILNSIAERANVENVHPHRFRRTLATQLASRGMPIQEIQRILGHSNVATTMRYIEVSDESIKSSYIKYSA